MDGPIYSVDSKLKIKFMDISAFFYLLQVIKVYSEDDSSKTLEIPSDITARDVCQLLILKNHYIDDHNWTLFEELTHTGLGKTFCTTVWQ